MGASTRGHPGPRRRPLLCWSPGCGKTAPLICAGAAVGGRQLWITASVLIPQTLNDIALWRPSARVQRITSGKSIVDDTADVVIVGYDLMRRVEIWKASSTNSNAEIDGLRQGPLLSVMAALATGTRAFYGATIYGKGRFIYPLSQGLDRHREHRCCAVPTNYIHTCQGFPLTLSRALSKRPLFLERYCVTVQGHSVPSSSGPGTPMRGASSRSAPPRVKLSDVTDLPPLSVDTLPSRSVRRSPGDRGNDDKQQAGQG